MSEQPKVITITVDVIDGDRHWREVREFDFPDGMNLLRLGRLATNATLSALSKALYAIGLR